MSPIHERLRDAKAGERFKTCDEKVWMRIEVYGERGYDMEVVVDIETGRAVHFSFLDWLPLEEQKG